MTVEARFYSKIAPAGALDCWEWTAAKNGGGYGRFRAGAKTGGYAHRWAWEHLRGEIPDGLTVDHLCRVRHCVNPWHMELVPRAVNARRGQLHMWANGGPSAPRKPRTLKSHCLRGHSLDGAYTYPGSRRRACGPCRQLARRAAKSSRKDAI